MRAKGKARKLTSQSGDSESGNVNNGSIEFNSEENKSVESENLEDEDDDDNLELDLEDEDEEEEEEEDYDDDESLMKENPRFLMETKMSLGTLVPSSFFLLDPSIIPAELYLGQSQCPATTHPEVNSLHGLGLGLTLGVWTKVRIPGGTHFGPFVGKIRPMPFDKHFAWQIAQISDANGTCSMWVDASEPGIGNWMKFVRTSYVLSLRNMKAVLLNGQIYYKVTRDIKEGEELLLKDRKVFEIGDGRNHETSNVSSSNPITRTLLTNGTSHSRVTEANSPSSTSSGAGGRVARQGDNGGQQHLTTSSASSSKVVTKTEPNQKSISEANIGDQPFTHPSRRKQIKDEREEEEEEELEELDEDDDEEEQEVNDDDDEEDDDDENDDDDTDRLSTTTPKSSQDSRSGGAVLLRDRHFSVTGSDSNEAESKDPNEILECAACSETFNDVAKLEEHLVVVHCARDTGLGEYKCGLCPKVFSWKSNLLRHQSTHEDGRRYNCENCHKIFTDPSNLQRHIRSQHIGARSHACPECGKTFATSSGLKQHTHIHSSVKPFQCEVCLKSYTQFSNLCRHKRMHADCRMQIKCHKCGQAFATVTSLSKHKRFCEGTGSGDGDHQQQQPQHQHQQQQQQQQQQQPHHHRRQLSNGCSNLLVNDNNVESPHSHPPPRPPSGPLTLAQQPHPHPSMNLSHQLMFYPRPGFPFYPPSMVAYPMFPAGAGASLHQQHQALLPVNPLFMQSPSLTRKPDSPDSSVQATTTTASSNDKKSSTSTSSPQPQQPQPQPPPPPPPQPPMTEIPVKEKRTSEGSESDASDISSVGVSDDIDLSTDSELDSIESDNGGSESVRSRGLSTKVLPSSLLNSKKSRDHGTVTMNNLLFVPRREHSPKQGAVYPVGHESNQKVTVNGLGKSMSASGTDMPFDLSVNSKAPVEAQHSGPKTMLDGHHHGNGKGDDQPLDLRVSRKRKSSSVHVIDLLHKSHVFGEHKEKEVKATTVSTEKVHQSNHHHHHHHHHHQQQQQQQQPQQQQQQQQQLHHHHHHHQQQQQQQQHQNQMMMMASPPAMPPPPPPPVSVANFVGEQPPSPNKFPMAYPRPIHPLMMEALYRMEQNKPKFTAFQSPDSRVVTSLPAFPVRYPFLNPLISLNNGNNSNSGTAFDMLRNQMEKMGKPYHDVLSPHMNKIKERYSCKFCGKIFPRSANLTRHLRTHTGEQPYKCKYCERSFSISSNLQRHVRNIHNKEKPFKCPLCDRCFGQQTNLDRHLKKHESDGPTILDDVDVSPKSAELLNDKDDTYFDEIRNFIGKVTEPNANSRPPPYVMGTSGYGDTRLTMASNHARDRDVEPLPRRMMELDDDDDDDDVDVDADDDPRDSMPIKRRLSPTRNDKDDLDSETSSRRDEDADDDPEDPGFRRVVGPRGHRKSPMPYELKLKVKKETDDLNVTDDGDNGDISENTSSNKRGHSFQDHNQSEGQTVET